MWKEVGKTYLKVVSQNLASPWRDWGKPWKFLVGIVSTPAEIHNGHFSTRLLLSENCLVCLNYDCTKWSEIPIQLFKTSGDFMHHQVSHSNILCSAHTVHLCTILWISEQIKQWLFPYIAFNGFCKCDKVCSLHGTNWILKCNWRYLKDWCFYSRQCSQNHSRKLHMEDF